MSASQTVYRLYAFDSARKIVTAEWLNAQDDADAIAKAEAAGFGSKGELWDGKRLVAQLESSRLQA